jgi:hypothetical protein
MPQEPGNINLYDRPKVPNKGGLSTVYSGTFGFGDKTYVLPLADEGRILTDKEAEDKFRRTGQHLGAFDTQEEAEAYSQQLHKDYEAGRYIRATTPKFSETVNVTAKEPIEHDFEKYRQTFPLHMEEIYLGTPTKKPTGTYTPEGRTPPKIDPAIQPLWDKVMARHPFAANFVSEVGINPDFKTEGHRGEFNPNTGRIDLRDPDDENSLLHELTHGALEQAFTDEDANKENYLGPWPTRYYEGRRGERIPRIVASDSEFAAQEADALKKVLRDR